jgi:hypothetical protein
MKEQMTDIDQRVTNLEAYNQEYYETMEQDDTEKETNPNTHTLNNQQQQNEESIESIKEKQTRIYSSMDNIQANMGKILETIGDLTSGSSQNTTATFSQ